MAKAMTLLWATGSCPCWRVMIALEEKNLQGYNQKLLSFDKMEHKSKEVLQPCFELHQHGGSFTLETSEKCTV
uniref:GST N-terminal domain-containing protein n=1 Tax=Pundamilia nyererei TaxID=303518 RepID=A0A3B4EU51_9CICH